jgi:ribosomal protein S18 acetylase RimI-like enzyme
MQLSIRSLTRSDLPTVVSLIREFAAFENLSDWCEVNEERLGAAMCGDGAVAECLVAFDGQQAIGYAIFYPNFATFRGQRGLYLEDIYVNDGYRGKGVGEAMLREIARLAAARGYERIDFMVLDWNTSAVNFYKKLGAVRDEDERHFKFTDDAFKELIA